MKYVDAGYAICLAVLFLYGVSVVMRRRRLRRVAARRLAGPAAPAPVHEGARPGPTPT